VCSLGRAHGCIQFEALTVMTRLGPTGPRLLRVCYFRAVETDVNVVFRLLPTS
jgi:hypothetical protein